MQSGNLKETKFISVVDYVINHNFKGHIVFKYKDNEKKLYFNNKNITGASSNDPTDYLGQYLINEGVIDLAQFNKAYRTELETDVKMGAILSLIGLAPVDKLKEALQNKVIDTSFLISCWPEGTFEISTEYPMNSENVEIKIVPADIVKNLNVRQQELNQIISMFNVLGEFPDISVLDKDIRKLKKIEQQIVNLISIGKNIRETLTSLPVHFYLVIRHIHSLFKNGIIHPGKGNSIDQNELYENLLSTSGKASPEELTDITEEDSMKIFKLAETAMQQKNFWKAASYFRVLNNAFPHNIVFRDSLNSAEYNYILYFYKNIFAPFTEIRHREEGGLGIISDPFEQKVFSIANTDKISVRDIVSYFKDEYPEVKVLNSLERLHDKKYIEKIESTTT